MEWHNEVLVLLAVVVNSLCFRYAYIKFDTRLCTNYILCLDSALTIVSNGIILLTSLTKSTNVLMCSIHTLGLFIMTYTFPTYNFTMVYTRYKRIATSLNGGTWKSNGQLINSTNWFIVIWIIIMIIQISANSYLN